MKNLPKNKNPTVVILHRDQFAAKLDFKKSFVDRLSKEKWKGLAGGGILAAIVFLTLSISEVTYGIIFTTTVLVFIPVVWPAIITLIVGGAASTVILAYLSKFFPSKTISIPKSFESKLDELAISVFALVFVPAVGTLLFAKEAAKEKKLEVRKYLIDWGYNPEWIDPELDKLFLGNPTVIAFTSSLTWRSFRKEYKRGNKRPSKGKALTKDIPNPDKLKNKMLEITHDLVPVIPESEIGEKQQDYISALEKL